MSRWTSQQEQAKQAKAKARLAAAAAAQDDADEFLAATRARFLQAPRRCQFMWDPGTWPYARRCDRTATRRRFHQVDQVDIDVCDEHYEQMASDDLIASLDALRAAQAPTVPPEPRDGTGMGEHP